LFFLIASHFKRIKEVNPQMMFKGSLSVYLVQQRPKLIMNKLILYKSIMNKAQLNVRSAVHCVNLAPLCINPSSIPTPPPEIAQAGVPLYKTG